jgi:hypothetical protein
MTEPEQLWWGWRLARIIVPLLVIGLAIGLLFASLAHRRDQRQERLIWARRLLRTTDAGAVQGVRPSPVAGGGQSRGTAADKPDNSRKRSRRKRVGNDRIQGGARRRPT